MDHLLAPFGIMGLVYTSVSTNGLEIFTEYGQLLLVLLAAMAVVAFVTNPLLAFACFRKNPLSAGVALHEGLWRYGVFHSQLRG